MKILLIHNYYKLSGGEDEVLRREKGLLVSAGHEVVEYVRDNNTINDHGVANKITLATRTLWARESHRDLRQLLNREKPNIAHFHNIFPLISPSAYYACASAGVPVVQTLHNPRLICPAATLSRNGKPCEDCVHSAFSWPAVRHACYQDSRLKSALVGTMLAVHRLAGTWSGKVDRYIASTKFYRRKFAEAGIPRERIALKPHFVEKDPGARDRAGDYALFIGRLSPEKGVPTLLKAWESLKHVPLRIRGEGPLAEAVQRAANAERSPITIVPRLSAQDLLELTKGARFLVWPSEGFYETFGLVAIDAFACGVPVIASGLGAMAEIVTHGSTGVHFRPADSADLAAKVDWAWSHPEELETMGRRARLEFERAYTRERNLNLLEEIYHQALNKRSAVLARFPPRVVFHSGKHVAD